MDASTCTEFADRNSPRIVWARYFGQRGCYETQSKHMRVNGQFPLRDAPAGNHGSCILQTNIQSKMMDTTIKIPCRRV